MPKSKRRRKRHPLLQAALVSAVTTIAATAVQSGIGLGLRAVDLYPPWFLTSVTVTAVICITAFTQYFVFLRRWAIGLTVSNLGVLAFTGLHWLPDINPIPGLQHEVVRSWSLALSCGAIFGGIGWLLTSLLFDRFRGDPAEESVTAEAPESGRESVTSGPTTVSPIVPTQTTSSAPSSSHLPVNHSGGCYVVFCRIDGLTEKPVGASDESVNDEYKRLKTGEVAASVAALATVMSGPQSYSSPFGRFVLVPHVKEALRVACSILERCAQAGVQLAVGIAWGPVEITQDLFDENVVGPVINRAARLAHLRGGAGNVAVDHKVWEWADDADVPQKFSKKLNELVKKTSLHFHWLEFKPYNVAPLPDCKSIDPTTEHVVVYDIAGFSEQDAIELKRTVHDLKQAVEDAAASVGLDVRDLKNQRRYAPAGDGGVVVLTDPRRAWTFSISLLKHAKAYSLEIRVGLTTGPVVFVDSNYPVGLGIYQADELSALPKQRTGCVCVSEDFWETSYGGKIKTTEHIPLAYEMWRGVHREDGQVERLEDKKALILVLTHAADLTEDRARSNANSLPTHGEQGEARTTIDNRSIAGPQASKLPVRFSTADLRRLLTDAFPPDALIPLCFDSFRSVHHKVAVPGLDGGQRIQLLLEHAILQGAEEKLLDAMARYIPEKVFEFRTQFASSPSPDSEPTEAERKRIPDSKTAGTTSELSKPAPPGVGRQINIIAALLRTALALGTLGALALLILAAALPVVPSKATAPTGKAKEEKPKANPRPVAELPEVPAKVTGWFRIKPGGGSEGAPVLWLDEDKVDKKGDKKAVLLAESDTKLQALLKNPGVVLDALTATTDLNNLRQVNNFGGGWSCRMLLSNRFQAPRIPARISWQNELEVWAVACHLELVDGVLNEVGERSHNIPEVRAPRNNVRAKAFIEVKLRGTTDSRPRHLLLFLFPTTDDSVERLKSGFTARVD
jgi:class 3 adenylate cyclase